MQKEKATIEVDMTTPKYVSLDVSSPKKFQTSITSTFSKQTKCYCHL